MQPTPKRSNQTAPKRAYPPFFEKVIPIALIVISLLILVLMGVIFYVEVGAH